MLSKSLIRISISATLLILLILSFATPALAFDGRGGDTVTVGADEVVNDDLYVAGETIIIDGTVKGDVVAFAQTIIINGTVEGDLIAAGKEVIINGTVQDDARIAGAVLFVGENAKVGSDIIGAGASLEAKKGSTIGQDVIFAGGQALFAGDITRNVNVSTGGMELRGTIGGDVVADVGDADEDYGGGMGAFMQETSVGVPNVKSGLTIGPDAKIGGTLEYTSAKQLTIPAGVVAGKVTYLEPKVDEKDAPKTPTMAERVRDGALDIARTVITLILFGLLLIWLFPAFIRTTTQRIKTAPLPSLGWGVLHIAAFFFALLVLLVAMLVGGIVFEIVTLEGISGAIVSVSFLTICALIIGFMLAVWFVAQIIVSILTGQLILARIKPELAENKYWPLIIGVVIYALLVAIPIFGSLVWWIVVLLGLGALWHFGQEMLVKKPVV